MNKYKIEGNLNFFDELYKSLDKEENNDDENKCLITNQLLTDKYVTLNCGHKFNYIPLYHDIVNHKNKFNKMEGSISKLNINEIRCPYCRKKQIGTLIYYEELGLEMINGVNFYDEKLKQTKNIHHHKCEYKYPNNNYDPTKEETDTNSKYLNYQQCGYYNGTQISIYNHENPSELITYGDSKYYCCKHKKDMIKQYKTQEKDKEKLEKKQAKELEKQIKLLEKQNVKVKEKEEKQKKAKELKKQLMLENVVLGPSVIESQIGCIKILKTGSNKGNQCGCKIFSENMCKRHYTPLETKK